MQTLKTVSRYHDFSSGHVVTNHEGACQNLHGHNYRAHACCVPVDDVDELGRVVDFAVIKKRLFHWIEENWDHRFLVWGKDPRADALQSIDPTVLKVPFNPTAENMAEYLLTIVGPRQFEGTGVKLSKITLDETRKCSASCELER